ncbi:sensor histidine kinase [Streptococcus sp. DD12]|uniref:sensor histidine kinase n=1 Tax=Streptococcus sp. DD12 TaxID=1777880 RepID=UPI0007992682|nr:GHKL domain-containing protein [Streptococcus sp. DD12]KXT75491.1 Histidine kinase of the competence regulon ComD [Streptococcus sp. DD12]
MLTSFGFITVMCFVFALVSRIRPTWKQWGFILLVNALMVIALPQYYFFILPLYFLFLGIWINGKNEPVLWYWYWIVYPIGIVQLLVDAFKNYLLPAMGFYHKGLFSDSVSGFIVLFAILLAHLLLSIAVGERPMGDGGSMSDAISHLKPHLRDRILLGIGLVGTIYYGYSVSYRLLGVPLTIITMNWVHAPLAWLYSQRILATIAVILLLLMILSVNYFFQKQLRINNQLVYQNNIDSMSHYAQQVEGLYEELRGFRHDYVNILRSLQLSIDKGDIQEIRDVYGSIVEQTKTITYDPRFEVGRLSAIDIPAVKSVLFTKLIEAESAGVDAHIEATGRLTDINLPLIDYIVLLTNLCDNAIDAARQSAHPKLDMAMIAEDHRVIFIIENSTAEQRVSVTKIYSSGVTSKAGHQGLGLSNVANLVDKYSQVTLETQSYQYRFRQMLTVHMDESIQRD